VFGEKRLVIGIDTGGSISTAIIVTSEGTVVAEETDRLINLQDESISHAASTLIDLIQRCCQIGKSPPETLKAVVIGMSGLVRGTEKTALSDALHSLGSTRKVFIKNVVVESDTRIALEAAFAGGPGIVVVVNAGSAAFYRTEEGKILRSGGWGRILGNEGGAYSIARDALIAVVRHHDGRGEKTVLSKKAMDHFHLDRTEDIVVKTTHGEIDISSFVAEVVRAESEGDRTAHAILMKNANDIAELVRAVALQVRPKTKIPVALMGEMLASDTLFSRMVKERIKNSLPFIVIQKPKFPSAFGAAIIGLNAFT